MCKQKPLNPLVNQHPVDTLIHVQSIVALLQDHMIQNTQQADTTTDEVHINTGHYALLKTVNDALDYEIDRLDKMENI